MYLNHCLGIKPVSSHNMDNLRRVYKSKYFQTFEPYVGIPQKDKAELQG